MGLEVLVLRRVKSGTRRELSAALWTLPRRRLRGSDVPVPTAVLPRPAGVRRPELLALSARRTRRGQPHLDAPAARATGERCAASSTRTIVRLKPDLSSAAPVWCGWHAQAGIGQLERGVPGASVQPVKNAVSATFSAQLAFAQRRRGLHSRESNRRSFRHRLIGAAILVPHDPLDRAHL